MADSSVEMAFVLECLVIYFEMTVFDCIHHTRRPGIAARTVFCESAEGFEGFSFPSLRYMSLSCIFHGIYVGSDSAEYFNGGSPSCALVGVSHQLEISRGDRASWFCILLFTGICFAEAAA